jgi:hypothetical protein
VRSFDFGRVNIYILLSLEKCLYADMQNKGIKPTFELLMVNDSIKYNDPDDKSKGYKVKTGKDKLEGNLPIQKGGRPPKKNPPLHHHSTVTDFARLRGWSTSVPFSTAVR